MLCFQQFHVIDADVRFCEDLGPKATRRISVLEMWEVQGSININPQGASSNNDNEGLVLENSHQDNVIQRN